MDERENLDDPGFPLISMHLLHPLIPPHRRTNRFFGQALDEATDEALDEAPDEAPDEAQRSYCHTRLLPPGAVRSTWRGDKKTEKTTVIFAQVSFYFLPPTKLAVAPPGRALVAFARCLRTLLMQ